MSNKRDIFDAISSGTVDDIKYFIEEKGVSFHILNQYGATPLYTAAVFNNSEAVKYLISAGADINMKDGGGGTVLLEAARHGNIELAKWLVSKKANVNAKAMDGKVSVLDMAKNEEMIQYLKSVGAKSAKDSGGCYIATAVYNSYDCPQVCTLRRYRDNMLSNYYLGRLFINLYYTISPVIVKIFGKMGWFTRFCRNKLDRIVHKLQTNGYEGTPYKD